MPTDHQVQPPTCTLCGSLTDDLRTLYAIPPFAQRLLQNSGVIPLTNVFDAATQTHSQSPFLSQNVSDVCHQCRDASADLDLANIDIVKRLVANEQVLLDPRNTIPLSFWALKTSLLSVHAHRGGNSHIQPVIVAALAKNSRLANLCSVRLANFAEIEPPLTEFCYSLQSRSALTVTLGLPHAAFIVTAGTDRYGFRTVDTKIQKMVDNGLVSVRTIYPMFTRTQWPFLRPQSVVAVSNVQLRLRIEADQIMGRPAQFFIS